MSLGSTVAITSLVEKFEFTFLKAVAERQMRLWLNCYPFEVFDVASWREDFPLARKAIEQMKFDLRGRSPGTI
jgi:hypothetical protein